MALYIIVVFQIFITSCKIDKSLNSHPLIVIPDSLMHIVHIDSINKDHLQRYFAVGEIISECNLNKKQLLEIEEYVYRFLISDTSLKNSVICQKFMETHRQYIILGNPTDQIVYIYYTHYFSEQSKRYFQRNKHVWNSFFGFYLKEDIFQMWISYSVKDKNIRQFNTMGNIFATPDEYRR